MNKQEFLELCNDIFQGYGFVRKGHEYYRDMGNDIVVVFGLQKSSYGPYYYMEYGMYFKTINLHLPYPKFYELNINCGRIMTTKGKALRYETMTDEDTTSFSDCLRDYIKAIISTAHGGLNAVKEAYILSSKEHVSYLLGDETLRFLGVDHCDIRIRPDE